MVGYDARSPKLTNFDVAFAGASSGFITRAFCQPLDVLKIRFQLQVEPISQTPLSKYRSLLQAIVLINQEEGIRAFWKGHVPAQCLSIVYGSTQFWCFEILSKRADAYRARNHDAIVHFSCGALAGGIATLISFPFDVIRTRLVAQSERFKIYKNVINAFEQICKNESYLVLFRGLTPTIVQVAPHAGVQFMCYKIFDKFYRRMAKMDVYNYTFIGSILSGSLAGLCAKTAIYPLDLVRKRMQVQGFQMKKSIFGKAFVCDGMVDCICKTIELEGFKGLFKGLSPSLIKAVITSGLHFSSYEVICKLLEVRH